MVKVLVAAIIIAIGLLGIATLQVKALQASTNAEQRAIATDIAASLADRIRANLIDKKHYVIDTTDPDSAPACAMPTVVCAMEPGDGTATVEINSCTAKESDTSETAEAEMAIFDLYEVRCAESTGVEKLLPGGKLKVECEDLTCDDKSSMRITISWQTRTQDDAGDVVEDSISMLIIPGADIGAYTE